MGGRSSHFFWLKPSFLLLCTPELRYSGNMVLESTATLDEDIHMAKKPFTTLTVTQNQFLEGYLRGTGKTLSEAQAVATYGIKNLRARMSEFRSAGLVVRRNKNTEGRAAYAVSSRDVDGSRAYTFI